MASTKGPALVERPAATQPGKGVPDDVEHPHTEHGEVVRQVRRAIKSPAVFQPVSGARTIA